MLDNTLADFPETRPNTAWHTPCTLIRLPRFKEATTVGVSGPAAGELDRAVAEPCIDGESQFMGVQYQCVQSRLAPHMQRTELEFGVVALNWRIDGQARIVCVTAKGDVTRVEFDAFLDEVEAEGALAYRKLFDSSAGDTSMSPVELLAIGVRVKSFYDRPAGALAIVLPPTRFGVERMLGILATAKRPIRLFKERAAAQRWLLQQHTT